MNVNTTPAVAFNAKINPAKRFNQAKLNKYAPLPITIPNFHIVDKTLMRGAKPTEAQLKELKSNGVKSIISFCTNFNPNHPNIKTPPDEANWAKKLGMDFYWMPMWSNRNPKKENVDVFFAVTNQARKKGEKVFIHCRHGADRTGLFSAIYRLKNQNVRLSDVIRELMAYGHDANRNQNVIPYIIDFKDKINPNEKFFAMIDNTITNISKMIKDFLKKFFN